MNVTPSRKQDNPTGSVHTGDVDFDDIEDSTYAQEATWSEVCTACCVHTPQVWAIGFGGFLLVCFFLYFFVFGLELLKSGVHVSGGCTAGALFGDGTNPISGLMIGILATVLLQSDSSATSIVCSLVAADAITVKQAIYVIMGVNIGTSVTNTIVAMGHMGDRDQLERAFAGATLHHMFNIMTAAILLPVELATGFLFRFTTVLVANFESEDGHRWVGPVKKYVSPLAKKVIIANKNVIKGVAKGASCDDYYPLDCNDPANPTKKTCSVGLIACDKKTDKCPAFFEVGATRKDDQLSGLIVATIGLIIMFVCLFGLVNIVQRILSGGSSRVIQKATGVNGYLGIILGAVTAIFLQAPSITTCALTPLVGIGVLRLEQMFSLTLGANIGRATSAILAAQFSTDFAFQLALAYFLFNIIGVIIWHPLPMMRNVPIHAARQLGKATRVWREFPLVYIGVLFFVIPSLATFYWNTTNDATWRGHTT